MGAAEMESLRKCLIQLEEDLQAERREKEKLKHAADAAVQREQELQRQVESMAEEHALTSDVLKSELETVTAEHRFHTAETKRKVAELEFHVAGFDTTSAENERLRERVDELTKLLSEQTDNQLKETNKMKKEAFALRMQLEQTFRNSLHEMDVKYHEKAYAEMAEESKTALVEQAKLKEELALQIVGIHAMMQRYDEKDALAKKLLREKGFLQDTCEANMRKLTITKRKLQKSEAELVKAEQQILDLENANLLLKESNEELEAMTKDAGELRAKLEDAEKRAEKWKKRAHCVSDRLYSPPSSTVGSSARPRNSRKLPPRRRNDRNLSPLRAASTMRTSASTGVAEMRSMTLKASTSRASEPATDSVRSSSKYDNMLAIWNKKFSADNCGDEDTGIADVKAKPALVQVTTRSKTLGGKKRLSGKGRKNSLDKVSSMSGSTFQRYMTEWKYKKAASERQVLATAT